MASHKRKNTDNNEDSPACQKRKCILHVDGHGDSNFTYLTSLKTSPNEKLQFLHNIRDRRLSEPPESTHRMGAVCDAIPESIDTIDLSECGYHRQCYQTFTKNLDRLQNSSTATPPTRRRSPRKSHDSRLFPAECIFCDKPKLKVDGVYQKLIKFTLNDAWSQVEDGANTLHKESLYRKVKGFDLFAVEAQFHNHCRKQFGNELNNFKRKKGLEAREETEHERQVAAHNKAFELVLTFIRNHVISEMQIIHLSALRMMYIQKLHEQAFPNVNYRSEKLLQRIQKHPISSEIEFQKVTQKGCIGFYLVYNNKITVGEAIANVYSLSNIDKVSDVAKMLRSTIQKAFRDEKGLPWPPTADDLDDPNLPSDLTKFLSIVIAGTAIDIDCKTKRLVLSIGQDICRTVTAGEWKLPKHVLLCSTIRHLYRSRQLTTILNRLGHCESYDFGLELETAMSQAIDEMSSNISGQIVKGADSVLFHSEWDNLNKITTNIHGSNVVNSAGGIMIQEITIDCEIPSERTLPILERSKQRSLGKETPASLEPFHLYNRIGPSFPVNATFTQPNANFQHWEKGLQIYSMWRFARITGSNGVQSVSAFGGFVSATGKCPKAKSTIDYYPPINEPITEYSTVAELLKRCSEATSEVGQDYAITTFDLGVCMKALPLIWKLSDKYDKHIVLIGQFHQSMNYISMLCGHKMKGSGYKEILLEAQLVTSGCLNGVINGKAYAKALFCVKTVCEAMERLLFESFVMENETEVNLKPQALLNLVIECNKDNLEKVLNDISTRELLMKYMEYEDKVRSGHLGKTAQFWFSFIEHVRLLMMLLYSVKVNDFSLFHKCMGDMADLYFAYGGQNYARYLTWFEAFLTNIDLTHPGARALLEKGAIAVARSLIPGSFSAVDKTMEETFMRFAKSSGGLSGIFNMFPTYQRHCRTTSARAQMYEKLLDMCGMISDPDSPTNGHHRELEAAEIKKSEAAVERTISAIRSFTNPFTIADKKRLYSLASGAPVADEVEKDLLNAENLGKEAKQTFIKERFVNKSVDFFDPVKKLKLRTMDHSNKKVTLTTTQGKLVQYQDQSNLAMMLLVKSQLQDEPIDLNELMCYTLTPVPHSLGTPDGFFSKTNKAAMLHFLLQDITEEVPYPHNAFYIQDGNAMFHELKDLPPTFGGISFKVLDNMAAKLNFVFSTDSYHEYSIKSQERLRRGTSEKLIVDGPATRKPVDMKYFLQNEENKEQLCVLLLKTWSSTEASSKISKCPHAFIVVQGKVYKLTSESGRVDTHEIPELESNQEETDTRIILYLKYIEQLGFSSALIRTPDSDICFILLHHAHTFNITIYLDIGVGKHRKIVDVTSLATQLGQEYCSELLALYVFTGEDCTSAFKGKGKVGPLKKLQENPKYHEVFRQLGNEWVVTPSLHQLLESFTCLMYGYPRCSSVNEVRVKMLKKMVGEGENLSCRSKVEFSRLPPCRDALRPHVQRVNHRLALYKRAATPNVDAPNPYDEQGWLIVGDTIEPNWSCGPVLPSSLVDLLDQTNTSDNADDDDDDEMQDFITDYEEILEYLDDE